MELVESGRAPQAVPPARAQRAAGLRMDARQRRLRWMASEVGRMREELRRLHGGVAALAEAEQRGRLTQELRAEFDVLRAGRSA